MINYIKKQKVISLKNLIQQSLNYRFFDGQIYYISKVCNMYITYYRIHNESHSIVCTSELYTYFILMVIGFVRTDIQAAIKANSIKDDVIKQRRANNDK